MPLVQLSALSLIMPSFMSPKNISTLNLQLCKVNKYAKLKERQAKIVPQCTVAHETIIT